MKSLWKRASQAVTGTGKYTLALVLSGSLFLAGCGVRAPAPEALAPVPQTIGIQRQYAAPAPTPTAYRAPSGTGQAVWEQGGHPVFGFDEQTGLPSFRPGARLAHFLRGLVYDANLPEDERGRLIAGEIFGVPILLDMKRRGPSADDILWPRIHGGRVYFGNKFKVERGYIRYPTGIDLEPSRNRWGFERRNVWEYGYRGPFFGD